MLKSTSILLLSFVICLSAFGQDEFEVLSKKLDHYENKDLFNGIVLIAKEGEVTFSRTIGYASFEEQIKLGEDIPMPISSITKPFTAIAIMILAEKQLLQFDDPVKKYLEDFPYDDITIRHLLNNTAGFKRIYKNNLLTTDEILTFVNDEQPKLLFEPGEQFQYSNLGYSILAALVKEIAQRPFSQFLEDEIFRKIGMDHTFLLTAEEANRIKANSYDKKNRVKEWFLTSYPGAKGIYASANDLLKFDAALSTDELVSQDMIAASYKSGVLNDGTMSNYGFGWRKWKGIDHLIFHAGDWVGNESILFRDIEKQQTIIILANRQNAITKWQLMDEILPQLGYEH